MGCSLPKLVLFLLLVYCDTIYSQSSTSTSNEERFIYTVRHGERVDNVDKTWKQTRKERGEKWDDPPLSDRGLKQASETGKVLSYLSDQLAITAVFVSPFTRTIQTAHQILNQLASPPPPLYVEPGLAESLNACMDPPGIPSELQMRELSPYINFTYNPVFPLPLPKETGGDVGCYPRVAQTMEKLMEKTKGNILIVSHGSPIASAHLYMFSRWAYVGQCTVSYIEYINGTYIPLSIGESGHLSDQTNLHPVQSKPGETEKAMAFQKKIRDQRNLGDPEPESEEELESGPAMIDDDE